MKTTKVEAFHGDIYAEQEFLSLKKAFDIKTIYETGSYKGVTTLWFSLNFDKVISIEIDALLHTEASEFISDYYEGEFPSHVNIVLGNSIEHLCDAFNETTLKDRAMFFLDAHTSGIPCATPLELQLISEIDFQLKPIIAIHDFKNPDSDFGFDVYPDFTYEFESIKPYLDKIYREEGYMYYYNTKAEGPKRGMIYICPNK